MLLSLCKTQMLHCQHHTLILSSIHPPNHNPSLSNSFPSNPSALCSLSLHTRPRPVSWLARVAEPEIVPEDEEPIKLLWSSTSIFATTDDPTPLQVATSVMLTGAISIFLVRAVRRRASLAKEQGELETNSTDELGTNSTDKLEMNSTDKLEANSTGESMKKDLRSAGASKSLIEQALDGLKGKQTVSIGSNSPTSAKAIQALLAGISAGVIALILYKFTLTIKAGLNQDELPDDYSVRQLTINIRTIVNGFFYVAPLVFGANSAGLLLYASKLAIDSFMDNMLNEEDESRGEGDSSNNTNEPEGSKETEGSTDTT